MKPTRVSTLVLVTVVCAVVTWLALKSLYQHLPPLPWTSVPALLVAALAEALIGRDLRARIAGRRGLKPAAPLFVSRIVALAKATSLAAAIIAGVAAGFDIYLSGSLNAAVPRHDAAHRGRHVHRRHPAHLRRAVPRVLLPGAGGARPRAARRVGPVASAQPDHAIAIELELMTDPARP